MALLPNLLLPQADRVSLIPLKGLSVPFGYDIVVFWTPL